MFVGDMKGYGSSSDVNCVAAPYVPRGGGALAHVVPADATAHAQDTAENLDKVCLAARLTHLQNAGELTVVDVGNINIADADNPANLKLLAVGNRGRQQNLYPAFRRAGWIVGVCRRHAGHGVRILLGCELRGPPFRVAGIIWWTCPFAF